MVFRGIGSGHQDHLRLFNIRNGIGHCATAECGGQTGHRGAVSEPGAVIHIIGFKHRAGQFLGQIVFLIGYPGRGEHPQAV